MCKSLSFRVFPWVFFFEALTGISLETLKRDVLFLDTGTLCRNENNYVANDRMNLLGSDTLKKACFSHAAVER